LKDSSPFVYSLFATSFFVINNEELSLLQSGLLKDYIPHIFYYGVVVAQLLTLSPLLVLFIIHTPKDHYPATKNNYEGSLFNAMLTGTAIPSSFIHIAYLALVYSFYFYDFYTNSCKNVTQITIFISVLGAIYLSREKIKLYFLLTVGYVIQL
jgi:hypothetical protein